MDTMLKTLPLAAMLLAAPALAAPSDAAQGAANAAAKPGPTSESTPACPRMTGAMMSGGPNKTMMAGKGSKAMMAGKGLKTGAMRCPQPPAAVGRDTPGSQSQPPSVPGK